MMVVIFYGPLVGSWRLLDADCWAQWRGGGCWFSGGLIWGEGGWLRGEGVPGVHNCQQLSTTVHNC